jgi:hypothetical protein
VFVPRAQEIARGGEALMCTCRLREVEFAHAANLHAAHPHHAEARMRRPMTFHTPSVRWSRRSST